MGNAPVAGCHSDDDVAAPLPSSTSTVYQQKPYGSRPVDDVTDDELPAHLFQAVVVDTKGDDVWVASLLARARASSDTTLLSRCVNYRSIWGTSTLMNALSVEPNPATLSIIQRLIDDGVDIDASSHAIYNAPERLQSVFHALIWSADIYEHPDGVPMITMILCRLIKRLATYTDINVHGATAAALQTVADPLSLVKRSGPLSPDVIQALVAAGGDPFWLDKPWLHPSYIPAATRRDDFDDNDIYGGWYTPDGRGWQPCVGDDIDIWVRHSAAATEGWQYARVLAIRDIPPLLSQRVADDTIVKAIAAKKAKELADAQAAATAALANDDNNSAASPDDEVASTIDAFTQLNVNDSRDQPLSPLPSSATSSSTMQTINTSGITSSVTAPTPTMQLLVHYHWRSTRDREWIRWSAATCAPAATQYPHAAPTAELGGACLYARLRLYQPESPLIAAIDRGMVECRERRAIIASHILAVSSTLIATVTDIITAFI